MSIPSAADKTILIDYGWTVVPLPPPTDSCDRAVQFVHRERGCGLDGQWMTRVVKYLSRKLAINIRRNFYANKHADVCSLVLLLLPRTNSGCKKWNPPSRVIPRSRKTGVITFSFANETVLLFGGRGPYFPICSYWSKIINRQSPRVSRQFHHVRGGTTAPLYCPPHTEDSHQKRSRSVSRIKESP